MSARRLFNRISFAAVIAIAACRAQPVTVPEPAYTPPDPDVTPLSVRGDTAWRIAAAHDVHPAVVSGPSARAPEPERPTVAARSRPAEASASDTTRASHHYTFHDISAATLDAPPSAAALASSEGPAVLHTQILLDRANFSVGVLDGEAGQNTQKALYFFQQEHALPVTGTLDSTTYAALVADVGDVPGARTVTVTDDLLQGPFVSIPPSVYAEAQLPCLCYVTIVEKLDERYHTTAEVLKQLNPGIDLFKLTPGTTISVPNVLPFDPDDPQVARPSRHIARIQISKSGEFVHALAADGSIVYHFPTTVGSEYTPSPSGDYHVVGVEWHPPYLYDPAVLDGGSGRTALLPPGPNSPVGIVWIALSREHVGIHGTPRPDLIGLNSSHGCVRLANWDAAKLAKSVGKGVPVEFDP